MIDNDKKEKVYQYLGLPFGSLNNEGGNDWRIAVEAVEAEEKLKRKNSDFSNINYGCEISYMKKMEAAKEINDKYKKGTLWRKK